MEIFWLIKYHIKNSLTSIDLGNVHANLEGFKVN